MTINRTVTYSILNTGNTNLADPFQFTL